MDTLATTDDLQLRWRALSEDELPKAQAKLDDATVFLRSQLKRYRVEVNPEDEVQSHALMAVCCDLVRRTLGPTLSGGSGERNPYTQETVTAGVFSQTYMYANPNGEMYLTKAERSLLGIGRMRVGSLSGQPVGGDDA